MHVLVANVAIFVMETHLQKVQGAVCVCVGGGFPMVNCRMREKENTKVSTGILGPFIIQRELLYS
jgi:hypothetical protein